LIAGVIEPSLTARMLAPMGSRSGARSRRRPSGAARSLRHPAYARYVGVGLRRSLAPASPRCRARGTPPRPRADDRLSRGL